MIDLLLPAGSKVLRAGFGDAPPGASDPSPRALAPRAAVDGIELEADSIPAVCARLDLTFA